MCAELLERATVPRFRFVISPASAPPQTRREELRQDEHMAESTAARSLATGSQRQLSRVEEGVS